MNEIRDIRWADDVPDEIRAEAEPLMETLLPVIPTWCHWIDVDTRKPSDKTMAETISSPEYRHAYLTIFRLWLDESPDRKARWIAHEFLHIPMGPIDEFVEALIEHNVPKDARKVMTEVYERIMDGVVSDLTESVLRLAGLKATEETEKR